MILESEERTQQWSGRIEGVTPCGKLGVPRTSLTTEVSKKGTHELRKIRAVGPPKGGSTKFGALRGTTPYLSRFQVLDGGGGRGASSTRAHHSKQGKLKFHLAIATKMNIFSYPIFSTHRQRKKV